MARRQDIEVEFALQAQEITELVAAVGDPQQRDDYLDQIAALTDPGADRLLFFDDSGNMIAWLELGTNLSITGTTLNATGGGGGGSETTTTLGALINGASAKTTPVDADMFALMDSAASNIVKKLSWANVKATAKTYFDTLYQPIATVLTNTTAAFTTALETKLNGIASGATANSADATLLARANHTGTQSADTLTDGSTNKAFLATERTKLTGIATGATANSSDATLLDRANHTGSQAQSTITSLVSDLAAKQPLDSDLTAIAALTTTSYGRSLLELANLAALMSSLSLSGTNTGDNAVNSLYSGLAASKQDTLVSATNIKTINGSSVLGSGNLVVSGSTTLTEQADPSTPASNEFTFYAKKVAGRGVFNTINDDGLISPMQTALYDNATYWWVPTNATAGLWLGTQGAGAGTFTNQLPTTTNAYTAIRRSTWKTVVTTTNQQVGQRSSEAIFFRGNAARLGGFFFFCRFGIENWTAGDRLFVGLTIGTAAIVTVQPSTLLNTCGFGIDAGDTAITFMSNDGSGTATKTAIAGQPALAANQGYDAYIYCKPNDTVVYFRLDNINTGANIIESSVSADLPVNTVMMMAVAVMSNGANTPVNSAGLGVSDIYVETDR